jgi:hypothetical protein
LPEQLWWIRRGGPRVARRQRPASEGVLREPGRGQDVRHAREVLVVRAVRGARNREVTVVEAEALEHAGAHGGERLERLGRRPQEDGARTPAAAHRAVAVDEAPREAMHALHVPAAKDADGAGGAHATTVSPPGTTS